MHIIKISLLGVVALVLFIGCSDTPTSPVQPQTEARSIENLGQYPTIPNLNAHGHGSDTVTGTQAQANLKISETDGDDTVGSSATYRLIVRNTGDELVEAQMEFNEHIITFTGLEVINNGVIIFRGTLGDADVGGSIARFVDALRDGDVVIKVVSSSVKIEFPLRVAGPPSFRGR